MLGIKYTYYICCLWSIMIQSKRKNLFLVKKRVKVINSIRILNTTEINKNVTHYTLFQILWPVTLLARKWDWTWIWNQGDDNKGWQNANNPLLTQLFYSEFEKIFMFWWYKKLEIFSLKSHVSQFLLKYLGLRPQWPSLCSVFQPYSRKRI